MWGMAAAAWRPALDTCPGQKQRALGAGPMDLPEQDFLLSMGPADTEAVPHA